MNPRPDNLVRHELIGREVEVASATNSCLQGLHGKVIDETRNLLVIETSRGERMIPKAGTSLVFQLPDGNRVRINGSILVSQPENRIHKRMQKSRCKL